MLAPVRRALAARSCARLAEQVAGVSATDSLRVFNTNECFHYFQRNTCQGIQSTLSTRALKGSVAESAACACDHLLLLLFLFLRQILRTKNAFWSRSSRRPQPFSPQDSFSLCSHLQSVLEFFTCALKFRIPSHEVAYRALRVLKVPAHFLDQLRQARYVSF